MSSLEKCPICEGSKWSYEIYCKPCMDQRDEMQKLEKQRKRDKAFGSPWDYARERK